MPPLSPSPRRHFLRTTSCGFGALALHQHQRAISPETVKMGVGMQDVVMVLLPEFLRIETVVSLMKHGRYPH